MNSLKNIAEKLIIDEEHKLSSLPSGKAKRVIVEKVFGNTTTRETKRFTDYLDEFVSLKTNPGTKSIYATTRNKLVEFDPRCTFETIDRKWLANF